jgi:ubiquinone/menaquinone biosynthesis C-methylase UbiE
MTTVRHGKFPDWYNKDSKYYDTFNENTANSRTTNSTIEKLLKKYKARTVLDLTCGTGSQVFWLLKRGFEVIGSDFSPGMLKVARMKAKKARLKVKWLRGDMRSLRVGQFDAVLTIFNAIGHLTKAGFEKTLRNIHKNLAAKGIYIFDIFNLTYLQQADNITQLSIEWLRQVGKTKLREIQHSIINDEGVLISYTTNYEKSGTEPLKVSKSIGSLQLYTAQELKALLARNGFKVLGQYDMAGKPFSEKKTERILTVAQKI